MIVFISMSTACIQDAYKASSVFIPFIRYNDSIQEHTSTYIHRSIADGAFRFYVKLKSRMHERSQLDHIICYEAAVCYHNERNANECGLLIFKNRCGY